MKKLPAAIARPSLVVMLVAALAACDDDDNPTGVTADLVGTWQVTSFTAPGFPDLIAAGMGLTLTLTENEYTISITNDQADFCDGATNCTDSGTYSATSSQITLDPGTVDAITFNYSIQGSTMTWTGSIEGTPVTIVATRTS